MKIEAGTWYQFPTKADAIDFIHRALIEFADTLETQPDIPFLLTKPALRVTPHGHHFNYRSTVNRLYFDPIIYVKENNPVNNFDPCTCVPTTEKPAISLVRKYANRDKQKVEKQRVINVQGLLEEDPTYKAYLTFVKVAKKNSKDVIMPNFYDLVPKTALNANILAEIEKENNTAAKKCEEIDNKAEECVALLAAATDASTIGGILSSYGFLRYDESED